MCYTPNNKLVCLSNLKSTELFLLSFECAMYCQCLLILGIVRQTLGVNSEVTFLLSNFTNMRHNSHPPNMYSYSIPNYQLDISWKRSAMYLIFMIRKSSLFSISIRLRTNSDSAFDLRKKMHHLKWFNEIITNNFLVK